MSDETRFRQAFDVLLDEIPDPPSFDRIRALDAKPRPVARGAWLAALGSAVIAVAVIGSVTVLDQTGVTPAADDVTGPSLATPASIGDPATSGGSVDFVPGLLFGQELPWTLVFDNGYDRVKAIDLNEGIPYETSIPGGAAGDQPYRLTLVDGRLVVGWGGIYAYDVLAGETTHLGQATIYVPAAEEGRVWMVDYGGRIGANPPEVWQVSVGGEVLTEKKTLDIGGRGAIGVPGGLAVNTEEGIKLWDFETGQVVRTLGSELSFVSDTSANGLIAWCNQPCDQIQVSSADGDLQAFRHPFGGVLFHPRDARFSPDGRYLAAPAGRDVVLIDLENETTQAVTVFDENPFFIDWAPSGPFLFASTYSYGERAMSVAYVDALTAEASIVDLPFGGTLDFVVVPTVEAGTLLGFDCPVTIPTPSAFLAPEPWPQHFPSQDNHFWYGFDSLWTVLPSDPGDYGSRDSVWWSAAFPGGAAEPRPEITVSWRRLDADAPIRREVVGTNAYIQEQGWHIIAGIDPEEPGCWQVTATYKGSTLSYVYDNR